MECEIETRASYLLDIIVAVAVGQKQWNWFALSPDWIQLRRNGKKTQTKTKKNSGSWEICMFASKCVGDGRGVVWSIVEYVHLLPFTLHAFRKLKTNT